MKLKLEYFSRWILVLISFLISSCNIENNNINQTVTNKSSVNNTSSVNKVNLAPTLAMSAAGSGGNIMIGGAIGGSGGGSGHGKSSFMQARREPTNFLTYLTNMDDEDKVSLPFPQPIHIVDPRPAVRTVYLCLKKGQRQLTLLINDVLGPYPDDEETSLIVIDLNFEPLDIFTDDEQNIAWVFNNNQIFQITLTPLGDNFTIQELFTLPSDNSFGSFAEGEPPSAAVVNTATGALIGTVKLGKAPSKLDLVAGGAAIANGGARRAAEDRVLYLPPLSRTSSLTSVLICLDQTDPQKSSQCFKKYISFDEDAIDAASNYKSVPPGVSPTIIVIGVNGAVSVSRDDGNNWVTTNQLNLTNNISVLQAIVYNNYDGLFYIAGYDNKSNPVILVSENGYYWENIYITKFSNIFATADSYCAIANDPNYPTTIGQVSCWGNNVNNKLGLGDLGLYDSFTPARALIPSKIGLVKDQSLPITYKVLAGGNYHMCALRLNSNAIDCWGAGALGDAVAHESGYSTPVPTPVRIPTNVELPILSLVGGGTHECLLDSDNQVWCWGDNQYGEIDATSLQQSFPSPVLANYNHVHTYTTIASGANFTCGLENRNPNKFVNCWGKGFSSATNPLYRITSSASDFGNFSNISAGGNSACILSNSNNSGGTNLWCFGDNTYGQLGNGESGPFTLVPQAVNSNVSINSKPGTSTSLFFSKVVQSSLNTCGLDSNTNYAYCWGDNTYGQTGVANAGNIVYEPTSPIQINGVPGQFIDISIGAGSICLIDINKNTLCFGDNREGQLGIGMKESFESRPFTVNTLSESKTVESWNPKK